MDRLYVYYEKICNIVRKRGFRCRLVQGWKVAVVALACYGWWGVIYPELTMLPSTYEIVYEEQAEETKTIQKDAEVVKWNSTVRSIGNSWKRIRNRSTSRADCLRC